jgi:hypothetical protein
MKRACSHAYGHVVQHANIPVSARAGPEGHRRAHLGKARLLEEP